MGEISPGAGEARLGETVRGPGRPVRAREGEPVLQEIRRCPARCGRARAPSSCEEVPVLLKVSGTGRGLPTRPRGGVVAGRGAHPDAPRRKSRKIAGTPCNPGSREHGTNPGSPARSPRGSRNGTREGGRPGRRELCRYLRHFRLRGTPKRGSRSNREGNFAAICGTCGSGARQTGAPARAGGKSARIRGEMAREGALFPERSPVFLAVSGEERRFGPRAPLKATGRRGFSGPN